MQRIVLRLGLLIAILAPAAGCVVYDDRSSYRERGWHGLHHQHHGGQHYRR